MKCFALTTRDNTDFHRFSNYGKHEIPIAIGNGKGNLTVAVERRFN